MWCFRLRFDLGTTAKLAHAGAEWVVQDDEASRVVLRPADNQATITDARRLSLHGSGYSTPEQATAAGIQWRDRLTLAFAAINVGVDFGDRAPSSAFTDFGLATVADRAKVRALNDVHGLLTFECEPRPVFLNIGPPVVQVSSPHERLGATLARAIAGNRMLTGRDRLAYDLYAASFFEGNADARFVMLMMAIETLVDPQPRSEAARALVGQLVTFVRGSGLPPNEIASIVGTLRWLQFESIGQAGRRLVSLLGDREYLGKKPAAFFMACYDLRSRLVHGAEPRPSRDEVGFTAATLERFVADLVCAVGNILE